MQLKSKNESPAQSKRKPAKSSPPLATGPHYLFEIEHGAPTRRVCGIDEAGRGPLAGPVVAAAVIIDQGNCPPGLDDSKKLGLNHREDLFAQLSTCAEIGVGFASVEEIDRLNILWASMLAMSRAVANLKSAPHFALVDGNRLPKIACPGRAIVGGDGLALSIAAASIVAKVTRDRIMAELASTYPGYGWEKNRGYGTKVHLNALSSLGATPHHRRSFAPIRNMLSPNEAAGLDLVDENPLSL